MLAQDAKDETEVMFIQNAETVGYKEGKLTLKYVGSTTFYLADRPSREIGHLTTLDFVEEWGRVDLQKDEIACDTKACTLFIERNRYKTINSK